MTRRVMLNVARIGEENENEILGPKKGNERGSSGLKDFQIHISSMETICIHRMGR